MIVGPKIANVFQQQYLRSPGPEFAYKADDVKKEQTAFVLKAELLACNRERLAGEAPGEDIDCLQAVAPNANVLNRLVDKS